jgi:hypothetical protein
MTAYSPEAATHLHVKLAELMLSLPPYELESVRFSLEDTRLILEGRVPSYETKCRMEHAARAAGFEVQNGLRVTPGIVSFPPPTSL